jgi:hypothetical protein
MSTTPDLVALLPPVIRAFAQRHGIGPQSLRSDGSLTLTVDRRYRVRMRPAPHNRVALVSQLITLPAPPSHDADALIERLMRVGAGLLQKHGSTLCLDARQQALLLQQSLPADADAQMVEDTLADFSNALAFWSRLSWSEAESLQMANQEA